MLLFSAYSLAENGIKLINDGCWIPILKKMRNLTLISLIFFKMDASVIFVDNKTKDEKFIVLHFLY